MNDIGTETGIITDEDIRTIGGAAPQATTRDSDSSDSDGVDSSDSDGVDSSDSDGVDSSDSDGVDSTDTDSRDS